MIKKLFQSIIGSACRLLSGGNPFFSLKRVGSSSSSQPALDSFQGCASVVIPAINEAERIADVVAYALRDPATAEVIVVDDSSTDDTAALARQAGAKVITSSMLGKGASMRDGVEIAEKDIIVYLDGDLANLQEGIVSKISEPLAKNEVDFVKARFGRSGGRVTELTAKPMIKIFFPELSHIAQPLGGMIGGRKDLLKQLSFENGYGVDIGLLLDSFLKGARLTEVDIGHIEHNRQTLCDLAAMANEVSRAIFSRAKSAGRFHVEQMMAMFESQRQATANIAYILSRRKGRQKILLLDMDGTVTTSRYAVDLARAVNKGEALQELLKQNDLGATDFHSYEESIRKCNAISSLFRFIHRRTFEDVAHAIPIRPGVVEFVREMRRRGFMVGIVSDSYFIAAEIIRCRIFADFALAHTLTFNNGVCTGEVQINPAFLSDPERPDSSICKGHVLRNFLEETSDAPVKEVWAIGDNINDLAILRLADRAFAIDPKAACLLNDPHITIISSFNDLLKYLPPLQTKEEPKEMNVENEQAFLPTPARSKTILLQAS